MRKRNSPRMSSREPPSFGQAASMFSRLLASSSTISKLPPLPLPPSLCALTHSSWTALSLSARRAARTTLAPERALWRHYQPTVSRRNSMQLARALRVSRPKRSADSQEYSCGSAYASTRSSDQDAFVLATMRAMTRSRWHSYLETRELQARHTARR